MLLLVATLWSVLLLAWLILHWGILPYIDDWRPAIEKHASAALGLPVSIGQIEVRSSGWVPALELREVVLSDRDGRQALRLPRVSAAVSPQSLLALRLRFAQLYIEGAQLLIRRDAAGRLHIGGLDMNTSAALDDSAAADWFFQQSEFVIRGGQLRWVDEMRRAPPLELRDAELVVRNSLRHHDLRLDATPPPGWGQRFSLRGRFTQPLLARAGDWQRWSGPAYAELPGADVAALRQHVALPFELNQGQGALRLWLELQAGQWRDTTLDAALTDVNLRLAPALQPLAFATLQGRFSAQRDASGIKLQAERFAFTTVQGQAWPASRISLAWQQRQSLAQSGLSAEPVTGGELGADRLDLALMAGIAERLPLPAPLRQALDELAPEGRVQDLKASWAGPLEQPRRYRVQAQLAGLTIASAPAASGHGVGRPGWRNADLVLDANETGGEARLQVKDGALDLPGVFEQPLVALDQFNSKLVWAIRPAPAGSGAPPQIELLVRDVQ
ncbi:MAG TPA: TIGR02099 family protein, partial [Ideonella sp.]|nr:TIGR02099 family protein [Ideonella sp.]